MLHLEQKKGPSKKFFVGAIVATIFVIGLIGVGAYYMLNRPAPVANQTPTDSPQQVNTVDYGPPTEEEKTESEKQKEDIINKQNPPSEEKPQPTGDITLTLNGAGGTPLLIRALVEGTNGGACTASFTKSGQPTVTKTFDVVFEATSARCVTEIPNSEFGAGGEWQLSIYAKNGTSVSNTITQQVTVEK